MMKMGSRPLAARIGASVILATMLGSGASAAPVFTTVGVDYATDPFTFLSGNASFTFTGTGDIFNPTAISTGGTGAVNTIFGSPTTNFVDRGTVTFGPNDQYGQFAAPTPIRFSNGDNFIGLSATTNGQTFYGYAYTTNTVLNGYAFENVAGQAITATVGATAVPEPTTWAMMIGGFGLAGSAMRRRRVLQAV